VLTNLLPGFREVRAPLAAGYLWLLALWFLLDPSCEDGRLTESACQLDSVFSGAGLGAAAVASFAAYLLGALSITFFSAPLRRWVRVGGVQRPEFLRAVSGRAERYLRRLADETVARLSLALALTETSLEDVLDDVLGTEAAPPSRRRLWQRQRGRQLAVLRADSPAPPPPEDVQRDRLVNAMARELDDIVLTRLLGRDPDLFSEIDRHRAEVDLRLAIIPPLLVVLAVVATLVPHVAAVAVGVGAVLFVAALGWDALASQRQANEELAAALADDRVPAPALERVESEVTALIGRTRLDAMRVVASEATNAMRKAITLSGEIDSAPSRLVAAKDAVRDAQGHLTRVESTFPATVGELGAQVVEAVSAAVRLWDDPAARNASADWPADSRRLVGQSKSLALDFRDAVLVELERVKDSGRPEQRDGASPPDQAPRRFEAH
jgi:hypothetical protein